MTDTELQRKIREFSPIFLKKLIDYWNGLSSEKQAGYFRENEPAVIKEDLKFNNIPVQFRLKIIRYDCSLAPHVIAEVASQGIKVSAMAFRVTKELKYDPKHIMDLIEAYESSFSELSYEIRSYV